MNDVEFRIGNAVASLEIEGFEVTEDTIALARRCLKGEISYDDAVKSIKDKYGPGKE